MYYQAEILQALLNREGLYFQVAGETVEEKLEKLAHKCASLQVWYVTTWLHYLLRCYDD